MKLWYVVTFVTSLYSTYKLTRDICNQVILKHCRYSLRSCPTRTCEMSHKWKASNNQFENRGHICRIDAIVIPHGIMYGKNSSQNQGKLLYKQNVHPLNRVPYVWRNVISWVITQIRTECQKLHACVVMCRLLVLFGVFVLKCRTWKWDFFMWVCEILIHMVLSRSCTLDAIKATSEFAAMGKPATEWSPGENEFLSLVSLSWYQTKEMSAAIYICYNSISYLTLVNIRWSTFCSVRA